MSKRSRFPQSRRHILVYDHDWDLLSDHFRPDGPSPIGPGAAIRELVHNACQRLRQRIEDQQETQGQESVAQALREGAQQPIEGDQQ